MPKKTSRTARAPQAQRSSTVAAGRKNVARPLFDVENSRLSGPDSTNGTAVTEAEAPVIAARESTNETFAPRSASSRRPYGRRTTVSPNRLPTISREEEYAYIRSDLLTVFLLTVLMITILVVLTFVIGR